MYRFAVEPRLYALPVSPSYWRCALQCLRSTRMLAFAALCVALNVVLGYFKIPVGENLYILPSFVANSMLGLVCGPVMAIPYGVAKDLIGYFMYPDGGFFPGYTLTSVAGALVFALFFFRARITILRVFLCKLVINMGVNVLMGSLWSSILYSKGYYYYVVKSLFKNTALLPLEVILLTLLLSVLLPLAAGLGFAAPQPDMKTRTFRFGRKSITLRIIPLF